MTIAALLEAGVGAHAGRTAYGPAAGGVSFRRLLELSHAAATTFRAASVDHVALVAPNSPAIPVALFGAALAGVPFAPISYRLAPDAMAGLTSRLGRVALIANERLASLPTGGGSVTAPDELLRPSTCRVSESQHASDDNIAVLIFTSGTTGAPKAAVLRHRNLLTYVMATVEPGCAKDNEAVLVSVPPYHLAGVTAVLTAAYAGRRVVQLANFLAEEWISTALQESVTHAMVVPTMLMRIVNLLERYDIALPTLRHVSYGAGRMPLPVIERAMRVLPDVSFTNGYGTTETSSSVCRLGPEEHRAAFVSTDPLIRRRLCSVGRPMPGIDVVIRDRDGNFVEPGSSGEVWVRGPQVAGEYVGIGVVLTPDGWFRTNDGGSMDSDGYLYLEGRLDDVIVRGGVNLSPARIEDALVGHEAINDAGVIGAPDLEWGEKIVAYVLAESRTVTADEVRAWVASQLDSSQVPHEVRFVDRLPYNDAGKLLRRELRRWFSDTESPARHNAAGEHVAAP